MISLSCSRNRDPRFQQNFAPYAPPTAAAFFKCVTEEIWSPIVWRDGLRLKTHFESCSYMALDFDSGDPSLQEMIDDVKDTGVCCIIATTKSHRAIKTSPTGRRLPAVDRFRVIFRAESVCTDRELYEFNLDSLARMFGADVSCKDAARFFYPSLEVVYSNLAGRRLPWRPFDEDYVPEKERFERRRERLAAQGAAGIPPPWLRAILDGERVIEAGERHKTAYRIGANFAALGWDLEEAIERVMETSIGDIGEQDVRRAVENGFNAELGG